MIHTKRVYEAPDEQDGARFLVDRLWPRGVKKSDLAIQAWLKDAAPSTELRLWYAHDPARWNEFRKRYAKELQEHPAAWQPLLDAAQRGTITLLYSSREPELNNAAALKEFLERHLQSSHT